MKSLAIKLILPLTIISFTLFTKWWYALPVDAPDTIYIGFPLIFQGAGWHTSMSYQFFWIEFFLDFIVYFIFWLILFVLLLSMYPNFKVTKIVSASLWLPSSAILFLFVLQLTFVDNAHNINRPYDVKILETGYSFIWQDIERPEYYKYFPEEKKN